MSTPSPCVNDEKCLEILHDHFKESFARVVQMEKARDRQFFWVILLFALLCVEIGYPAEFKETVGEVRAFDVKVTLDALPLPALLNATWALTAAIVLGYCRKVIWVNRNYGYIHHLEDIISPIIGKGNAYRREGDYYKKDYPTLLDVSWYAYVIVFPAALVFAVVGLLYWERNFLHYPTINHTFDYIAGAVIVLTVFFYQVEPAITKKVRDVKTKRNQKRDASDNLMLP